MHRQSFLVQTTEVFNKYDCTSYINKLLRIHAISSLTRSKVLLYEYIVSGTANKLLFSTRKQFITKSGNLLKFVVHDRGRTQIFFFNCDPETETRNPLTNTGGFEMK
jgi:hypothetical protein